MNPPENDKNSTPQGNPAEQQWDNPKNPENASDPRDLEQLERQKKEAEIRKANLTGDEDAGDQVTKTTST